MKPKATVDSLIKLLEDVPGHVLDRVIPAGSVGVIVEAYDNPEGYTVDFDLPARNSSDPLALEFDSVDLSPEQFEVYTPERQPTVKKP
jgi:hypothetical protein